MRGHTASEPVHPSAVLTATPAATPTVTPAAEADGHAAGRRAVLRRIGLSGAAVAGTAAASVAGSVAGAPPATAATGDALVVGRATNTAAATTAAVYTGATSAHAFTFSDNSGTVTTAAGTAALVGHATALSAGVLGSAVQRSAVGVVAASGGVDGVGLRALAGGPGGTGLVVDAGSRGVVTTAATPFPLSLAPAPSHLGPPSTEARVGDVAVDAAGAVWFCTAAGAPGTFVRLGGGSTSGAFTAVTPARVHDTRRGSPAGGPLTSGASRTLDVGTAVELSTGLPTGEVVVPSGATAVTYNLTVTGTTGGGWLAVCPGDAAAPTASSINWTATGQTLANGLVVKVDVDRQVRVFCGGGGSAHFLVDVTGYYR